MPKFTGKLVRDDASDFKLIDGHDVNLRNCKDLTSITIAAADTFLIDDISVAGSSAGEVAAGSEDSTGKVTMSQLATYIGTTASSITMPEITDDAAITITKIQDSDTNFVDNDTSIMTAGAIKDLIDTEVSSAGGGDITAVTITTDSGGGSTASVANGSADFSIVGTTGVGVTNSGTTITVTAVPGEIDHDSLNNFAANEHIDWTADQGGTNIHSGNYTNTTYSEATGSSEGLMSTDHHDKLDGIAAGAQVGTVTSVGTTGSVNGLTLTGTVTSSGNLTLGGTLAINNGDWSGTALADANIASASTWNNKQSSLTFGISNTNAVKIDAADVADDEYARFTANGLESRTLGEIKTDIGTGNSALVPAAGSSGHFLAHNGAFAQVAYSSLSGAPTIPTNYLRDDDNDTTTGTITAAGFTTTGTWTFDDASGSGTAGITTVHTGSSFADNDTSLMTAGAIKEKIEDYGYSTSSQLTTEQVEDIVGAMFDGGTETRIAATYDDTGGKINLVVDDMTANDNTTYSAGTLLDLSSTTFNVDLTEAGEAAIADGDYILFLDGGATGTHAKESLADLATLFAGNGLTASSSVLAVGVDDSTIEINSDALRIKDDGVTYAKIQDVSATDRVLGRDSSGSGVIEEISPANLRAMINVEDGSTADQTKSDIDGLAITTVGTIDTGTWQGTTIAVDQGGTGATNSNAWLNSRITTNADGSLNYDATGATAVNHDSLAGFVANEHIDWTASSAGTIHSSNYTNTTYSEATSSDAGLMSTAHHDKLDGIDSSADVNRTLDASPTDGNTSNSVSSNGVFDALATKQATLTFGIANNNAVEMDDADAAEDDYAQFTTDGLQGRSATEVKTDLSLSNVTNHAQLPLSGGTMTGDINAADNTIGFTKHEETSGTNVTVDFRDGHKADLAMTSNISGTLKLYFPAVSGNFLLVVKQDATGSRTIANYEAYESNGSTLAHNDGGTDGDIRWQGGAEPTFSTGANRRDMISFYWDATDRVCYAAYSGNFF